IFEAKVGKGSLIMCSFDLLTDGNLPEIRQLRFSLLKYMQGKDFNPQTSITEQQLCSLLDSDLLKRETTPTTIYE
ncbi:MAG: hypothetical protein J5682_05700, partial [Prevotella sp.]|nr:hypothetical protein [Prevotella sp.]